MTFAVNPPRVAIADKAGGPTPEFYRWMAAVSRITGGVGGPFQVAKFLTLEVNPDLNSERVFTLTAGHFTAVDGGAGGAYTLSLADTAVTAGTYGSASETVSFTVDAKGRITGAAEYALSTTNITEGTNLYYTDARARAALSAGAGIDYNSGTGVIALDPLVTRTITVTGAVAADDYLILADATSGVITVNLPAVASSAGRKLVVKKIDASANVVTLDGNAAETIDGAATRDLTAQYDALSILCDGATWWIV